jgi:hypothetical protein
VINPDMFGQNNNYQFTTFQGYKNKQIWPKHSNGKVVDKQLILSSKKLIIKIFNDTIEHVVIEHSSWHYGSSGINRWLG